MARQIVLAAVIVHALSLNGAWWASAPRPVKVVAPLSAAVSTGRPLVGFALNLHHTERLELYLDAVEELADLGFNAVEVVTPVFQTHGASQEIRIETGPGRGPSRRQLVQMLRHARSRGLSTCLMPVVLLTEPAGNEWRGKIQPEHWDSWWRSYRRVIAHFLEIANEANVDIFCVGSELLSTEGQDTRWRELIAWVRAEFPGRLTYSTNWDHFRTPAFWDALDLIGINGYWDLTAGSSTDQPGDSQLVRRWGQIRQEILGFSAAKGRPILLTEVGYPSLPWALKHPWNYVNHGGAESDGRTQARGYQSFLAAWQDVLCDRPVEVHRSMAGVFFYAWDPYSRGGTQDTGYGIKGKPTYSLLRNWLKTTVRQRGS